MTYRMAPYLIHSTLASPAGFGRSLAILPVFAVLQIVIGSIFGRGLARIARLDPASDEGKEVAICSSFANSGESGVVAALKR